MDGRNGYDYGSISDGKFYDITVNGVSVNSTVRATYYNRDDEFDLEKKFQTSPTNTKRRTTGIFPKRSIATNCK